MKIENKIETRFGTQTDTTVGRGGAAAHRLRNGLIAALHAIRAQLIGEVPPETAFCEFDCPRSSCRTNRARCPIRRNYAAAMLPAGGDAVTPSQRTPRAPRARR